MTTFAKQNTLDSGSAQILKNPSCEFIKFNPGQAYYQDLIKFSSLFDENAVRLSKSVKTIPVGDTYRILTKDGIWKYPDIMDDESIQYSADPFLDEITGLLLSGPGSDQNSWRGLPFDGSFARRIAKRRAIAAQKNEDVFGVFDGNRLVLMPSSVRGNSVLSKYNGAVTVLMRDVTGTAIAVLPNENSIDFPNLIHYNNLVHFNLH